MTIWRLAVISAMPWYWHFQIKFIPSMMIWILPWWLDPSRNHRKFGFDRAFALHSTVFGIVSTNVNYFLRYRDIFWRNLNKKLNLIIYQYKRKYKRSICDIILNWNQTSIWDCIKYFSLLTYENFFYITQ